MLDILGASSGKAAADAVSQQLRTLYRARPFTKAIPFNNILGATPIPLWLPQNSYYEVAAVSMRGNIAGIDIALCDSQQGQPFMFVFTTTSEYKMYNIDPGYRSLLYQNAQLLAWDPSGSGVQIKGVIYGWEVTPEGYYR